MTNKFRALCAELVDAWLKGGDIVGAMNRARAELAEPEPEGPSDEELEQWYKDCADETTLGAADHYWAFEVPVDYANDLARAVLAHWGNPAPAPPADGEVAELEAWLRSNALTVKKASGNPANGARQRMNRAAELLERQATACAICERERLHQSTRAADLEVERQAAPVPVSVSERPWEREGWCDAEGRFWAEHISRSGVASWRCAAASDLGGWAVRCLPAHALPLPEVNNG